MVLATPARNEISASSSLAAVVSAQLGSLPCRGAGQEDAELVPAEAVRLAGRCGEGAEHLREPAQLLVARLVASGVVHPLQPLEVEHHERQPRTHPADAGDGAEILVERAVVRQSGRCSPREGEAILPSMCSLSTVPVAA